MKVLPFVLISLLGGAIVPLQLAMVNAFRQTTGAEQIQATFYLYVGGLIASFVLAQFMSGGVKPPTPSLASWWMWLFGLLGCVYILCMFVAAPKIGSANTLLWVFLGQMFFAVLINQMGWFGLEVRRLDGFKLIGLCLIVSGGVLMIYGESRVH